MRILIIGFAKIKYMPYLNLYLDNIDREKNDVELLYWDRDSSPDKALPEDIKAHRFFEELSDEVPKVVKIKSFLHFRSYAKSVIKTGNYDFVIVLTTAPAVLLNNILIGKFRNKFIFDYRDYTLEKLSIYKKCVKLLVENSYLTVISSEKHKQFLPISPKIQLVHNFTGDSLNHRDIKKSFSKDRNAPIRFSYWGVIRNKETNLLVIKQLANDPRFDICFYGRKQKTAESLEQFCKDNSIENVRFAGEYIEKDRYEFVKDTDLLYNLYSADGTAGMAMGNKYYDGIIFYLPQICSKGSFMGERVEQYGIGLAVDPASQTFADDLYEYFYSINEIDFRENCDRALDEIKKEYDIVVRKINSLFNGINAG